MLWADPIAEGKKDQELPSQDTVYWKTGTLALVEAGKGEQK